MDDGGAEFGRPLAPARRLFGALLGHLLIFLASPGVIAPDGSFLLAILGCAIWGTVVHRALGPRRWRALAAEWFAGAVGGASAMAWIWFVTPGGVFFIGAGWGIYSVLAGMLLRVLRRRLDFPWALALGWCALETLRSVPVPPFGLGWMRLGHHAHHWSLLAGSARVWGPEGLSLVGALVAGSLGALWIERRIRLRSMLPALLSLGLAALLTALTSPPDTIDGPRLLLVQPAFDQERKMFADPRQNFSASRALTQRGLEAQAAAGEPPIDLVCWGESMLYVPLFEPEVDAGLRSGATVSPPWREPISERDVRLFREMEDSWIRAGLFGQGVNGARILPPGTSFLAGAEVYFSHEGELRRVNAAVLYDAEAKRSAPAPKRYLVPGAETLGGLERFAAARALAERMAGYVPDFVPASAAIVLDLAARDGRAYRFGASVCFDNGFLAPFVLPFHRADSAEGNAVDFHLVVSNEAWYRDTFELDQMVAFSRIAALATGRAVVRATNSGVSVAIGPDGRELGRVRAVSGDGRGPGRDRGVAGTLAVTLPVPAAGTEAPSTLYVGLRTPLRVILIAVPLLLALRIARMRRNPASVAG